MNSNSHQTQQSLEQERVKKDIELITAHINMKKIEAESKKVGKYVKLTILFTITFLITALVVSYAVNQKNISNECKGVCVTSINKVILERGFDAVEVDKEKGTVFVVGYEGMYTEGESLKFSNKIMKVRTTAKEGDTLIININSDGGDSIACSNDYALIRSITSDMKLKSVSVVDRAAHSCGYYLASASNSIFAQQGASVGNIGSVIQLYTNALDSLIRKLAGDGLKIIGSTRAKELFAGSPLRTDEDRAILQKYVDDNVQFFFDDVKAARGDRLSPDNYDEAFSAFPFTARNALSIGLIDGISGSDELLTKYYLVGFDIKKISFIE